MQYNSFEERINRKLATATLPPRGDVWEKIHQDLNKPPHNDKKKGWIWGLIAIIFALSIGIYYYNNTHQSSKDVVLNTATKREKTALPQAEKPQEKNTISAPKEPISKSSLSKKVNILPVYAQKTENILPKKEGKQTSFSLDNEDKINDIKMNEKTYILVENEKKEVSQMKENINIAASTISNEKPIISQEKNNKSFANTQKINIEKIDNQLFKQEILHKNTIKNLTNIGKEIPFHKAKNKWTWNVSAGNYNILYQSYLGNNGQVSSRNTRMLEALGVANIGVGDSTSNLVIYNDQSLALAAQTAQKVSDTSLLKITVSPTTQFATLGGEYRFSQLFGLEGAMSLYYQKMNRILIPLSDIKTFGEAIANSKTTPYFGNDKSTIPFQFYILEPKIMANLHFAKGHSDFALSGGFAYRSLIYSEGNNVALRIAQIASKDSKIYNPHNFSLLGRAKYTYYLNHNIGIFAAANVQFLLNRMYSEGISYKSPKMAGLEMGISF